MNESDRTLSTNKMIQYLAARAYQAQVACWYAGRIDSLISLNQLQSMEKMVLMRRLNLWNELLNG
jgi:hypothetical protein